MNIQLINNEWHINFTKVDGTQDTYIHPTRIKSILPGDNSIHDVTHEMLMEYWKDDATARVVVENMRQYDLDRPQWRNL